MEMGQIGLAVEILQLPSNEPPPSPKSRGERDIDDGDDIDDTNDGDGDNFGSSTCNQKNYLDQTLKELLWKAAKATYPAEWERKMLEMKAVNEDDFKHLIVIVDVREKAIVSMIEDIRMYLMEKWNVNKTKIERHRGSVLPRIKKRLDKQIAQVGKWVPRWSGEENFKVTSVYRHDENYAVDLSKEECSCRFWMLTGIPCCHGVSAIHFIRRNPEDLIPGYFRKEWYVECYCHIIHPTNGKNMWPSTEYDDILPPDYRRMIGRPKMRRRKDTFEKDDKATKRKQARRRNKDIPDEHLPDEPAGGSSTPQPMVASTQPAGTSTAPPPTQHARASSQPTPLQPPMRTKTTARKKATPPVVRSFAAKEVPAIPIVLRPKPIPRKKTKPPPIKN
ncbi:Sporozoite surface protein 2 [Senna tora]|uniref:Sporozoite surface protein 2 n=1 Tax=Senna tora TaxID=362788 RepID=A0A834TJH7_9FABA|nr:Sporozoite surface protein 2 [Senna tora]